jgi:hypothetical protein
MVGVMCSRWLDVSVRDAKHDVQDDVAMADAPGGAMSATPHPYALHSNLGTHSRPETPPKSDESRG